MKSRLLHLPPAAKFVIVMSPLLLLGISHAQVPAWEPTISLPYAANAGTQSAFSNGYGQHVLTSHDSLVYMLLGNDGAALYGHEDADFQYGDLGAAVTAYNGSVFLVMGHPIPGSPNDQIYLFQSTDGGQTWPADPLWRNVGTEVHSLDAFADVLGVHIVWDISGPASEVYYVRFDPPSQQWFDTKHVTEGSPTGTFPKVVTSPQRAHVAFVRYDTSPDVGATRSVDFSTNPPTWGSVTDASIGGSGEVADHGIARRGDSLDLVLFRSSTPRGIYATQKHVDGVSWPTATLLSNTNDLSFSEASNRRRRIAILNDTLYVPYATGGTYYGVKLLTRTPSGGWSNSGKIDSSTTEYGNTTVSASRTGVYLYWNKGNWLNPQMKRKVYPLGGSIAENTFLTGNNWITDILYIPSGKTVTAKANCNTYVLANKKIVVQSGGTLVVEPGANFYFESGASLEVAGTLTVQSGGTPAAFTRYGGTSETWDGLYITGTASLNNASISYATTGISGGATALTVSGGNISNCTVGANVVKAGYFSGVTFANNSTAVIVNSKNTFDMVGCNVTNASIGVEILCKSPQYSRRIRNSDFSGISAAAVLATNYSWIDITDCSFSGTDGEGIALVGSSPTVLRNTIEGFKYGLNCASGSLPLLQTDFAQGANTITGNGTGVQCEDESHALLGVFDQWVEGGYNRILSNADYDAAIHSGSIVLAENNWWGSREDPPGVFDIDGTSELDYDPWLEEDPLPGNARPEGGGGYVYEPSSAMRQALRERMEGRYDDAARTLQSIISSEESPPHEKRWAIVQLGTVDQRAPEMRLSEYVNSIASTDPAVIRSVRLIMPSLYLAEGRGTAALSALERNIQDYPNSGMQRSSFYMKFLSLLYEQEDAGSAQTVLAALAAGYPESRECRLARIQMANFLAAPPPPPDAGPQPGSPTVCTTPMRLNLLQNYPNPFNSSTTISYQLPTGGHVTLEIFDVLGRKIATLVDDRREAGRYSVTWGGTSQTGSLMASGIYLARFSVTSETGEVLSMKVNKLLLMK
ncbi:MAG: right-handed parallel beta-helix repeat-containing protein [Bacteroidota bacterium]